MNGMTNRDFLLHNINTLIQALQTLIYIGASQITCQSICFEQIV